MNDRTNFFRTGPPDERCSVPGCGLIAPCPVHKTGLAEFIMHNPLSEEDAEMLDIPTDKPEAEYRRRLEKNGPGIIEQMVDTIETKPEAEPLTDEELAAEINIMRYRGESPRLIATIRTLQARKEDGWNTAHKLYWIGKKLEAQVAELEAELGIVKAKCNLNEKRMLGFQAENKRLGESNTQLRNTLLQVTEERLAAHVEIIRLGKVMERDLPKVGEADKMLREAGYNPPWNSPVSYALTILARDKKVRRLCRALEFYADPWARREHPDDGVPDFYSEMDFGKKAQAALDGEKTDG